MKLSDAQIRARAAEGMISPFFDRQISKGVISHGLSSCGYDIRLGKNFKIFTNIWGNVVDPKNLSKSCFVDYTSTSHVDIPANSFALAESIEYIRMPRDLVATCLGKSTYARVGIIVNVTPLEPEWHGIITIEISNTTPCPARVYVGEGIMQIQFEPISGRCEVSYADRQGKYQDQQGIVLPKVK